MPKQRSTMTVADVKKMLNQQGMTSDFTAATRQVVATQEPDLDDEGQPKKRDTGRDNRTQAETARTGSLRKPLGTDSKEAGANPSGEPKKEG